MCLKRNKEPVRLHKKNPSTLKIYWNGFKILAHNPEFWVVAFVVAIFILAIIFALHEAIAYFVYNRGGL